MSLSRRHLRSRFLLAFLVAWGPSLSHAATVKVLMTVGNNIGNPEDTPLEYAHADAERMAKVFTEIGGVAPDRVLVVLDQPAQVVRARMAEMARRMAELSAAGHDVIFMLYVSAHARDGMLHLHGTQLPLAEVREFAQSTRARLRVLIVDACDSGAITRNKGGTPGPAFKVEVEKLTLEGQVLISSSGPAEPSQEWESLRGSLFTHHLLAGLRGDADLDSDGRITLAEAYRHAYRRTVVDAAYTGQHPSFDFDVTGAGEFVLTEPSTGRSALVFPSSLEGEYLVASQPRPDVVLEVVKSKGRPLRLAIPPGNYVVKKRLGETVGLLHIELPWGGAQEINEGVMVMKRFTDTTVKGGVIEFRPSSVMVLSSASTEPLLRTGGRWSLGMGYRRTHRDAWLMASARFGATRYKGVGLWTNETSAGLGLSAGLRWFINPVVLHAGLSVEGVVLSQSYVRDREEDIQNALGTGPLLSTSALGLYAGPTLALEIPLMRQWFIWLEARGEVRYLPVWEQPAWSPGFQGQAAIGWKF